MRNRSMNTVAVAAVVVVGALGLAGCSSDTARSVIPNPHSPPPKTSLAPGGAGHSTTVSLATATNNLRGAVTAAKTLWTENGGSFSGVTAAKLAKQMAGLHLQFVTGAAAASPTGAISFAVGAHGNSFLAETYTSTNGGECVGLLSIFNPSSPLAGAHYFKNAGVYWGETGSAVTATGVAKPIGDTCTAERPSTTNIRNDSGWSAFPPTASA